jgi:hypothetical protein
MAAFAFCEFLVSDSFRDGFSPPPPSNGSLERERSGRVTVKLRVIRNDDVKRALRRPPEPVRVLPTVVYPIVEPLEAVVVRSIEQLDRREWDALFPQELENWQFLLALERVRLAACEPVYFGIRSRGRLVAAVPAFVGRRALAEPRRARGRTQWRGAERALVLGSPFAAACRIGLTPRATAAEQALLVARLLRAARGEYAVRGLDLLFVSSDDAPVGVQLSAESLELARTRSAPTARLALPRWSLADYLSCFEDRLRGQLLRICAQSMQYERDCRVDLSRDLEPMLTLCRDVGLDEIGEAFFRGLLASSAVPAACLLVRSGDGNLAGFSVVLHDARALRDKLTVVRRRENDALVRGMIWLETLRFCLQRGIGVYESASELALSAARPNEIVQRSRWIAAHEAAGAAVP